MLEKSSRVEPMRAEVATLCGVRDIADSRESWLRRGARASGIDFRKIKTAFYEGFSSENNPTAQRIRAAAEQRRREEAARADAAVAFERLVALRGALAATNPDFHREAIG